jgi:REP element-mobilizing transposase RayT
MMNDKFHDRYRIPSARLKGWDYGRNGIYFITICTAGHQCYLGEITDGKMLLSEMGKVVYQNWKLIPSHFPFTELADFVVMPNHIHGIIIVDKMDDGLMLPFLKRETNLVLNLEIFHQLSEDLRRR